MIPPLLEEPSDRGATGGPEDDPGQEGQDLGVEPIPRPDEGPTDLPAGPVGELPVPAQNHGPSQNHDPEGDKGDEDLHGFSPSAPNMAPTQYVCLKVQLLFKYSTTVPKCQAFK